jgi:5-methyltetrahydropteroyltriglutamate--homocysteine methyltransferase
VRIDGKIAFSADHPVLAHYRFLHERARATPKLTIPSPSALLGRPVLPPIDARVYPERDELYADLGAAYRAAVNALVAAGCRYLQLDEVFIAMLCDPSYCAKMVRAATIRAVAHVYAELINTAIADIPADVTVTLHLCRGNFRSTYMGAGGYDAVEDVLFNAIEVHGYFMEYDDERSGGFEPLRRLPRGKRVALGLVTTKRGALESKDEIKRRIDAAAKFAPLEQLCLAPHAVWRRPRRATCRPRTSSGPSSSASSRSPPKSGVASPARARRTVRAASSSLAQNSRCRRSRSPRP